MGRPREAKGIQGPIHDVPEKNRKTFSGPGRTLPVRFASWSVQPVTAPTGGLAGGETGGLRKRSLVGKTSTGINSREEVKQQGSTLFFFRTTYWLSSAGKACCIELLLNLKIKTLVKKKSQNKDMQTDH